MMIFLQLIILSVSICASHSSFAKAKTWKTYPNSAIKYPDDPKPLDLGFEIPPNLDKSTWKVVSENAGVKTGTINGAPVYDNSSGRLSFVGFIPAGEIVKLLFFDTFGRTHYYQVKAPNNLIPDEKFKKEKDPNRKPPKEVWISGSYLRPN